MKNEFDLRTPEYLASKSFFKPHIVAFIALTILILIQFALVKGTTYYLAHLQNRLEVEIETLTELQQVSGPLRDLLNETTIIKNKSILLMEVKGARIPFSEKLELIEKISKKNGLQIITVTTGSSGILEVTGTGRFMQDIAAFTHDLETVPYITRCQADTITLIQGDIYLFSLKSQILKGELTDDFQ